MKKNTVTKSSCPFGDDTEPNRLIVVSLRANVARDVRNLVGKIQFLCSLIQLISHFMLRKIPKMTKPCSSQLRRNSYAIYFSLFPQMRSANREKD